MKKVIAVLLAVAALVGLSVAGTGCGEDDADVAFFFKQWGGQRPKSNGRELDGRLWDEYPTARERFSRPPALV